MDYSGSSSAKNFSPVSTPEREVSQQLTRLTDSIQRLHSITESLENRLAPILSVAPKSGVEKPGAPTPVMCSMAESIRARASDIEGAIDRMSNILDRIEL